MAGLNRNRPIGVAVLLAAMWVLASAAYAAETPLSNGVPLTGLSGTAGSEQFYKIDVPAGQDELEILTTGGTGDVDLYVRKGALPTTTSYDYRPYKVGNEETVTVTNPTAGTWYVMLRGYADYANLTLKGTYSAAVTIVTLANGVPVTGLSGAAASEQLFKIDVPAGQSKLDITISGGTGDADLYVKKDTMPTTTSYDYRPYLVGSEEAVAVSSPAAGTWYVMVRGYAAYSGLTLLATYGGGVGEELQNGVPVTGISGSQNSEKIYRIQVPAGQTNLEIASWGGTGDADLYVKFGARPTTNDYDYRPYLAGTDETVSVNSPAAGIWYVMLRGYSDYSGASLKASFGDVYTLQDGVPVNGLSGTLNSEKYYKIEVPSGQDNLAFTTSGGTGNVDVYIKRGSKPSTTVWDHRLIQPTNAENISIANPASGTWYVLLKAQQAYNGVTLTGEYSFEGTVVLLSNGVPVTNISGAQGSERIYRLIVPSGKASLEIKISGGTGDADLYVKLGSPPTTLEYDYRPYLVGSEETVTVSNPTGGNWLIMVRGYAAYAGLTLVATFTGGTTPPPEEVTTLQNGVAVTGISGAAEGTKFYKIAVPAGQAKLEIAMSGGTGDADLYIKKGAKPTTTDYDYRPYLIGNNETVTVDNPEATTWYIMLRGYGAFSGVTLKATYFAVPETVTSLTNGVPVPGLTGTAGSEKFFKIDVPAGQDFLNIEIAGGTGDADLYVKKGAKPTTASWDYRPYLIGNNEKAEIATPAAATWYVMVRGYQAYSGVTLTATFGVAIVGNNFTVDPNCAALWQFEDGNLVKDSIGTNTLTNGGVTASATAKEGASSGEWNGSDYMRIADPSLSVGFPLKSGTNNKKISVCCWFQASVVSSRILFAKNDYLSTTGHSFVLSVTHVTGTTYYVLMRIGTNGGTHEEEKGLGTVPIVAGRWYHLGATYDDSNRSYRIRLYDAATDAVSETAGTFAGNISITSTDVTVGAWIASGVPAFPWAGFIDEMVVFNDVLTAAEIDRIRQGVYGKP